MPQVSVITAVFNGGHHYLTDAYHSLASQEMPTGWTWEWIVQEDGMTGIPLDELPRDSRISSGRGRPGRACMARNLALSRASGTLIRNLDADDLLTPGALAREITVFAERPEVGWTACSVVDLQLDGSLRGVDTDPPGGLLEPGSAEAGYRAFRLAVHGATLCIRRDLVFALGGWPAMPATEDVGLMLALEIVAPGWFISEVGYHYRKHPAQSTEQPMINDPVEQQARRVLITERLDAMRRLGWPR
jgi:glycosyltransferase involved in cell wall biosynthesis